MCDLNMFLLAQLLHCSLISASRGVFPQAFGIFLRFVDEKVPVLV